MKPGLLEKIRPYIQTSQSGEIARRYFVVNGFDGALTMLGIIMGFYISKSTEYHLALTTCLGATIALTISGISSAYISEIAEQKKTFLELQKAMISKMEGSQQKKASRISPFIIAFVNGISPLLLSIIILLPVWFAQAGIDLPVNPFVLSLLIAAILIFFLGVFLGKISETHWFPSGLKAIFVAIITAILIYFIAR
jgi:predicted membrane protein (TIGR00267 family)